MNKTLNKLKSNIPFDTILTEIIKFCAINQNIKPSDFDVLIDN